VLRFVLRITAAVAALNGLPCIAQVASLDPLRITRTLSFETLRLPDGEHLGLLGGAVLFDIGDQWAAGPAVYGAATGRRGGLFVGGLEVQRRWALAPGWSAVAGGYVGGGGGGAAPVGSGLMLRPALSVLKDVSASWQAGLSWSYVRFPSGNIQSHQLGALLVWRGEFRHYPADQAGMPIDATGTTGLGFDRMALTVGQYRLRGGSGRRIGLVGVRAERHADRQAGGGEFAWGIESAGAATGGAAGYMEVLGTLSAGTEVLPGLLPSWRAGVRLAGGLGGGGAVPTGGGVIGKLTATTEFRPAPGWTVGAEVGAVRGVERAMRGSHAQVWVGMDLEPHADGQAGRHMPTSGEVSRMEWAGTLQHHTNTRRQGGTKRSLGTIGMKLERYLGPHLYLSGQAHSALSGGAGAYAVGLVGVGAATTPEAPWRAGAEVLVGAAGGGGMDMGGGALAQTVLWAGWRPRGLGEWRLGLGNMRTFGSNAWHTPLVELTWSRPFGVSARR
jgi:hypothetical protein